MSRATIMVLSSILFLAGCPSTDDSSGEPGPPYQGGGEWFNPSSTEGLEIPFYATGGGSGLACFLEEVQGEFEAACLSCLQSNCGSQLIDAFGVPRLPQTPGGACRDFLGCLDDCECEDAECLRGCADGGVNGGCEDALEEVSYCQSDQCSEVCGESGEGSGGGSGGPVVPPPPDFDAGGGPSEEIVEGVPGYCDVIDSVVEVPGGALSDFGEGDRTGGPRAGAYFQIFQITLSSGDDVSITMSSEDIDSFLYLLDDDCVTLASDDDAGGGSNAMVSYVTEEGGTFFILATTFGGEETGDFNLEISLSQAE
jgi:hypothetical protein